MQKTTNYGLKKPELTDFYKVEDFNYNADLIDTKLKEFENGTTPVGNANNLGGKSASEYALSKNFYAGDTYSYMQTDSTISQDGYTYRLLAGNMGLKILRTKDNWETYETFLDLANYLPKSGGNIYGNINLLASGAEEKALRIANDNGIMDLLVGADGSMGLIDRNGQWILRKAKGETPILYGTAEGNLPLTGGRLLMPYNGNFRVSNIAGSTGSYIAFDDVGGPVGYLGCGHDGKARYSDGGTESLLLHTGNVGDYAVPKNGGEVNGTLWFNSGTSLLSFSSDDVMLAQCDSAKDLSSAKILRVRKGDISHALTLQDNSTSNVYTVLHSGNVGDYALPKYGGTVGDGQGMEPFAIIGNSIASFVGFNVGGTNMGSLGFDYNGTPVARYYDSTYHIIHTDRNSAKVAIQESAPTDTTALWVW